MAGHKVRGHGSRLPLLQALLAGHIPSSLLVTEFPSGIWGHAAAAAREVADWPEWKRRAAAETRVSRRITK